MQHSTPALGTSKRFYTKAKCCKRLLAALFICKNEDFLSITSSWGFQDRRRYRRCRCPSPTVHGYSPLDRRG